MFLSLNYVMLDNDNDMFLSSRILNYVMLDNKNDVSVT